MADYGHNSNDNRLQFVSIILNLISQQFNAFKVLSLVLMLVHDLLKYR